MTDDALTPGIPAEHVPSGASQHVTAGPYSPVLLVRPDELAIISGRAAIDPDGSAIGAALLPGLLVEVEMWAARRAEAS